MAGKAKTKIARENERRTTLPQPLAPMSPGEEIAFLASLRAAKPAVDSRTHERAPAHTPKARTSARGKAPAQARIDPPSPPAPVPKKPTRKELKAKRLAIVEADRAAQRDAVEAAVGRGGLEPVEGAPADERPVDLEHRATSERCVLVQVIRATGFSEEAVARGLGISPATLKHFYADQLEFGAERVMQQIASKAAQLALKGDTKMITLLTKQFLGWGATKGPGGFTVEVEAGAGARSIAAAQSAPVDEQGRRVIETGNIEAAAKVEQACVVRVRLRIAADASNIKEG